MFLFVLAPVFALYVSNDVMAVEFVPVLGYGASPVGFETQFDIPAAFMPENDTLFRLNLKGGLANRNVLQNYIDGSWNGNLAINEYLYGYADYEFYISQNFFKNRLSVFGTFRGRHELAFDNLEYYLQRDEDPMSSWTGLPANGDDIFSIAEISGNRYAISHQTRFGFSLNYMDWGNLSGSGINFGLSATIAPEKMINSNGTDNKGNRNPAFDYYSVNSYLNIKNTIFQWKRKNGFNVLSLVVENNTSYRTLWGDHVPMFMNSGGIWRASSTNLNHSINNTSYITLYGPQFISTDCYPYAYVFFGVGASFGKLNNAVDQTFYSDFYTSAGVHLHLKLFNVINMFSEFGYVFIPDRVASSSQGYHDTKFGFYISL